MKITLEMAIKYADAADDMADRLRERLQRLEKIPVTGRSGKAGYNTVADVLKHLEMREQQINEMTARIAELESSDTDSEQVMEIVDRLGLSI